MLAITLMQDRDFGEPFQPLLNGSRGRLGIRDKNESLFETYEQTDTFQLQDRHSSNNSSIQADLISAWTSSRTFRIRRKAIL